MSSLPGGREDVKEYYLCAPAVVKKIKTFSDAQKVFEQIYNELVLPCVELIEEGNNHEAYVKYKSYTKALQKKYVAMEP